MHAAQPRNLEDSNPAGAAGGYALAVLGVLVAVAVAAAAQQWVGLGDLSLVFMLAVLVVAVRTSTGPAVLTAVLCFLSYNFFFIAPRYSFYIHAWQGVATVGLFLAAALLAGRLASRLAMQVHALRVANEAAVARQELGQRLAVAADADEVMKAADEIFRRRLDAHVWIRIGDNSLHVAGIEPPALQVLRSTERLASGLHHAETIEEHGWWFLPLRAPSSTLGVIGLKLHEPLGESRRQLARAMADDIAQALLRTRLVADLQSARLANETERLRNALLSSVSHDLRTPLAAIIGAAGSLELYREAMSPEDRRALLDTIRGESERLDRYIQNLLDMTRLGHGTLLLNREWIGVDELIGSAVGRLHRYRADARFDISVSRGIGAIWVQPALLEQALFNVIENAAGFSPPGEAIGIDAALVDGRLRIEVSDRGPGIPEDERERIFDMFYSVERGDRSQHGTGLGLAICRGMVAAHGGTVEARPGANGSGTVIRITLPLASPSSGPSA
ncbi:ATP-binding protein [Cognatiluteimonas profundi]|uniref:ATP-binding protein n=1 Tax=Cognatiluteimonas profundi TaxID=2594501 RepID=UPI00131ECB5B|nr:ATP-binding protein [Lysobacter profundi]